MAIARCRGCWGAAKVSTVMLCHALHHPACPAPLPCSLVAPGAPLFAWKTLWTNGRHDRPDDYYTDGWQGKVNSITQSTRTRVSGFCNSSSARLPLCGVPRKPRHGRWKKDRSTQRPCLDKEKAAAAARGTPTMETKLTEPCITELHPILEYTTAQLDSSSPFAFYCDWPFSSAATEANLRAGPDSVDRRFAAGLTSRLHQHAAESVKHLTISDKCAYRFSFRRRRLVKGWRIRAFSVGARIRALSEPPGCLVEKPASVSSLSMSLQLPHCYLLPWPGQGFDSVGRSHCEIVWIAAECVR